MTEILGRARQSHTLIVIIFVLALALLVPGWFWPDNYVALMAGVQAIGVVVALTVAALTLQADSRDRRVDRVLALHQELVTGEVQAARVALVRHLRRRPDRRAISVSLERLDKDPELSRYAEDSEHPSGDRSRTPGLDARLLLRFFERADAIRTSGAAYLPLYAELIGGHALWWSKHLIPSSDGSSGLTRAVCNIGEWLEGYAQSHPGNPLLTESVQHIDDTFQDSTP